MASETVDFIPDTPTGFHRVTPPVKVYPDSPYTLSWSATAHAASYDLDMDGYGATQTGITATSQDETAPGQAWDDVSWQVRACNGNSECSDWSSPAIPVLVSQREGGGGGDCPPLAPDCQPQAPAAHPLDPHTVSDGGTEALIVSIGYNAAGYARTLTRESDGTVYGTIQAMDAWGHATAVDEAEGATITRGYSQVTGLAQSLTAVKGEDTMLAEYTYDFDQFGNLATREDVLNGGTETEHYDALNRLIKSVLALEGGGGGTTTYDYDATGNRTQVCPDGACVNYSYGEGGAGPHAVSSSSDGSSYTYNENGEMTADNGKTLTWATLGQAIGISQAGTDVSLAYDAENARYRKTVATDSGDETVLYLGAAERIELNGETSIRRTLSLADLTIVDTGGANAQMRFVEADHLGSTIALTQSNGGTQSLSYSPFGQRMTAGWAGVMSVSQALSINQTMSDRGYTGQEGLDAVGLWDYNARLYDPSLGRFLSVDPLIAHPESTQGINPYSYVENNPLNKTDPTGMAQIGIGSAGCGALGDLCSIGGIDVQNSQQPSSSKGDGSSGGKAPIGPIALPKIIVTPNPQKPVASNAVGGVNVSAHNFTGTQGNFAGGGFGGGVSGWFARAMNVLAAPWGGTRGFKFAVKQLWSGSSAGNDDPVQAIFSMGPIGAVGVAEGLAARGTEEAGAVGREVMSGVEELFGEAAEENSSSTISEAFHYTSSESATSIRMNGLREGSYATPSGNLSPIQAQMDLALPPRGLPNAVLRIDLNGLRNAGFKIPDITPVGRKFNMPGGGLEMQFPYEVPPEFISGGEP